MNGMHARRLAVERLGALYQAALAAGQVALAVQIVDKICKLEGIYDGYGDVRDEIERMTPEERRQRIAELVERRRRELSAAL